MILHFNNYFGVIDELAVSDTHLNSDLSNISDWADKRLVTMNTVKSRNVVLLSLSIP